MPLGARAFGLRVELANHVGNILHQGTPVKRGRPGVGVSDELLTRAIHELRKALDHNPRPRCSIQTVHGWAIASLPR